MSGTRDWDAGTYHRVSDVHTQWANQVLTTDYVGSFEHGMHGLSSTFAWGGQATLNDTRDVQAYTIGFGGPGDPTISTGVRTPRSAPSGRV